MIIDGRKIAQKVFQQVQEKFLEIKKPLRLAAVLVGGDPELKKFLELKKKRAEEIGIGFRIYEFSEDIDNSRLEKELNDIAMNPDIHGIIIELPLPKHLDTQNILNIIPEEKDVDALSGKNKVLPPAVEAVSQIFKEYKIDPKGKKAVVFGQGLLVGKPVSHWLAIQGAQVLIIDEFTENPGEFSREADIIVSGVGHPNLITGDMVKDGAVVIDFGKDVDFENVSKKAGLITPPTGGVGPIVVAAVLKNLVELWS
ncbi:MAG: bifunctional 5,10-methylenetetrahydrofolate dehydrogenase/5,10-methenyltetrahydrofolate cyclohydrolase [Patescibacteria group bacterium]